MSSSPVIVRLVNRIAYNFCAPRSNDRERLGIDRYMRRLGTRHQAIIRRGHISEDGFKELDKLGPMLKGTVQVRFIDE